MKLYKLLYLFCLLSSISSCQETDTSSALFSSIPEKVELYSKPDSLFKGLLYSKQTMIQLESIVDSVNLDFYSCGLDREYFAPYQAKATHVFLENNQAEDAEQDMKNGISLEEFKEKYPSAKCSNQVLVLRYEYHNYTGEHKMSFTNTSRDYELEFKYNDELYSNSVFNKWIINPSFKRVEAFFFHSDFKSKKFDEKYARLLQYSECLIDTSASIHLDRKTGYEWDENSIINRFTKKVNGLTNKPSYVEFENINEYYNSLELWDSLKNESLSDMLKNDPELKKYLLDAIEEGLKTGGSNDEFEEYVEILHSKEMALELKRGRKVFGSCSMDNSPIIHAKNIAVLSAETKNWEIFVRAHMNIMNDYFSRASDASYAWEKRKTYARELELLNINLDDLILGVCLRIENHNKNHYYGSIQRMGRAISELENPEIMLQKIIYMVKDDKLDDHNRLIMAYLYLNFISYLEGDERNKHKNRILTLLNEVPEYFHQQIMINLPRD